LFGAEAWLRNQRDEPVAGIYVTNLGDLGQVWPHIAKIRHGQHHRSSFVGTGFGFDRAGAALRSRAEALERYCSYVYQKEQLLIASADELGDEAIDLDTLPRCSPTEISDPRCPLVNPDKRARIRWVRGLCLKTGRVVYIPAVLVYLYTGFLSREERICIQITTGCAAHTSFERALIAGILEVIERDAIAISWLQKLSLPRIELSEIPSGLKEQWDAYQRGSERLNYFFFDATTDLGFPVIYGLQVSDVDDRITTLVSCSAGLDAVSAVEKVMADLAACREAFRVPRHVPARPEECEELLHGATYMARREMSHAFDFLMSSTRTMKLKDMPDLRMDDPREVLRRLLDTLQEACLDAFAIDLTTDEALRAGMRVVRVVIPGLQPFSFHSRAQYLGHPRLFELPQRMGYHSLAEKELNQWPQPFA
jgi:ribosomal protein S12 methylthiotransferase accessory factor